MRRIEYIADALTAMKSLRVPPAAKVGNDVRAIVRNTASLASMLDERQIYAFTGRALVAASDLRIDTPERMERLIEAVTLEPMKIFLEAPAEEGQAALSKIRGFIDPAASLSLEPEDRIGVMVDILGVGRMEFRPFLMKGLGSVSGRREHLRDGDVTEAPVSIRQKLNQCLRIIDPMVVGRVEMGRRTGMSREEFQVIVESQARGDAILDECRAAVAAASGIRAKSDVMDQYWRMARFLDLLESAGPETPPIGIGSVQDHGVVQFIDPLRIGLHVIAMLALLSAEAREIAFVTRAAAEKQALGERLAPTGTKAAERERQEARPGQLRVVTLAFDMTEHEEAFTASLDGAATGKGHHGNRVRHPVRGHLFLARSGKLVWRKAHWRGTLDQPVIHRVTAKIG